MALRLGAAGTETAAARSFVLDLVAERAFQTATLDGEADARGASLAYRRLGRQWLRIDLADRLASHAHKVRSAGGEEPVDVALATSVGLEEAGIAKLMDEVGFAKAGEAWRWRGRRPPRQDQRESRSHAFAELAKLKR